MEEQKDFRKQQSIVNKYEKRKSKSLARAMPMLEAANDSDEECDDLSPAMMAK